MVDPRHSTTAGVDDLAAARQFPPYGEQRQSITAELLRARDDLDVLIEQVQAAPRTNMEHFFRIVAAQRIARAILGSVCRPRASLPHA